MKDDAKSDRFTIGAIAGGTLAVACCTGLPLLAGVVAAVGGGLAFGGIAAALVLLIVGGFLVIRRRRRPCAPSAPKGPAT